MKGRCPAKTKVYGDADPSLTYQVSGLKNGDSAGSILTGGLNRDAGPSLTYQVSGLKNGDTAGAVLNGGSLSRVAGENVGVYGINQGVGRITATRLSAVSAASRRITPGALSALRTGAPLTQRGVGRRSANSTWCRANNRHAVIRRFRRLTANNA